MIADDLRRRVRAKIISALAIFFLTAHSFLLPPERDIKLAGIAAVFPSPEQCPAVWWGEGGKVGPDILLCPAHSDFYPNYNNLSSIRHVGQ